MKIRHCWILAVTVLLISCIWYFTAVQRKPDVEQEAGKAGTSEVEYPNVGADYQNAMDSIPYCAEFLDSYESELLEFYKLFYDNRPEYDNFQYMVYQDGRKPGYFIWGKAVDPDQLRMIDEIQAFIQRFQCTYIFYSFNPYDEDAVPQMIFELPIARDGDNFVYDTIFYCEDWTADEYVVYEIPGHEHWFVDYFVGV